MSISFKRAFVIGAIVGPLGSLIVARFEKSLDAKLLAWQHLLALALVGAILGLAIWTVTEKLLRKDE